MNKRKENELITKRAHQILKDKIDKANKKKEKPSK